MESSPRAVLASASDRETAPNPESPGLSCPLVAPRGGVCAMGERERADTEILRGVADLARDWEAECAADLGAVRDKDRAVDRMPVACGVSGKPSSSAKK